MSAYTECMKPYMSGGGANRKLRFCVGAKLCSGKASTEAEAGELCRLREHTAGASPGSAGGKTKCADNWNYFIQLFVKYQV